MFSENLKTLRKSKGLSQEELAIRLHVVRQTISKWEKRLSVPDADLLIKIGEFFEVPVSELLGTNLSNEKDIDIVAEQLSRINEQLAIKNRRSSRIWKAVVIIIAVIIAINITIIVIFGIVDFNSAKYKVTGESVIFVRDKFPEGILYKASQDPENEAYLWSIHDLLLTNNPDMDNILADYATKYESYVHYYQEEYAHDEESLQAVIRPEWTSAVGENGCSGYISAIDLEWPGWQIPHEEVLEAIKPYRGKYRAIPVFAPDYSEIVDYFLMGIG